MTLGGAFTNAKIFWLCRKQYVWISSLLFSTDSTTLNLSKNDLQYINRKELTDFQNQLALLISKFSATLIYGIIAIGGGIILFKCPYKRSLRQLGLIPEGWHSDLLHGLFLWRWCSAFFFSRVNLKHLPA